MSATGYRGVHETSYGGTYFVMIWHEGKNRYVRTFTDPEEAARRYDEEALRLKGDRAILNFPLGMSLE